jgi:hypothetical protein
LADDEFMSQEVLEAGKALFAIHTIMLERNK